MKKIVWIILLFVVVTDVAFAQTGRLYETSSGTYYSMRGLDRSVYAPIAAKYDSWSSNSYAVVSHSLPSMTHINTGSLQFTQTQISSVIVSVNPRFVSGEDDDDDPSNPWVDPNSPDAPLQDAHYVLLFLMFVYLFFVIYRRKVLLQ